MKSKVILFCVFLFCSKIVVSIPLSDEFVGRRALLPTNWPIDQNASGKYPNTDFAQPQKENALINSAHQNEETQDYYANQGRNNYNNFDNINDRRSLPVKDSLDEFVSFGNGHHISDVPPKNTYLSKANGSQLKLENQNYRNQNWQSQYISPVLDEVVATEMPSVNFVREPYLGSVQSPQLNALPPLNGQYYQGDRTYPLRQQYQHQLVDNTSNNRHVANSASHSGTGGSIPYENYRTVHAATSNPSNPITMKSRGNGFVENSAPLPVPNNPVPPEIYNGVPYVENYETLINNYNHGSSVNALAEQSGNRGYVDNYRSHPGLSNTAPVNTVTSDTLANKSEKRVGNYGFDSKNIVFADNFSHAPVVTTDSVVEKSGNGKYENNYGSNIGSGSPSFLNNYNHGSIFGSNNPTPFNTYNGAPTIPIDRNVENSGNTKYVDNSGVQYGSNNPAHFDNSNPDPNNYHNLFLGGRNYDFKNIVTQLQRKNILSNNVKRFVVIHPNGTVEYMDNLEYIMKKFPNHVFLNSNDVYRNGAKLDAIDKGVYYTTQSPAYVSSNLATTPVLKDRHTSLSNDNLPANDNNPKLTSNESDYNLLETSSSTVSDYNSSPTPLVPITSDNYGSLLPTLTDFSAVISTTTGPEDNLTDEIITISSTEIVKDNVSNIPLTITTTAYLVEEPSILDTVTYVYNEQDEALVKTTYTTDDISNIDEVQNYSTTSLLPVSSPSPVDDSEDDIIIKIVPNKNYTQSNDTTIVSQTEDEKNKSQATYNSLTITDVPANSDDHSTVTTVSSAESNITSGDNYTTPGDNSLESKQSEIDLKVIINTNNDNEGDIIRIEIEVSDSADNANLSNDNEMIVVRIDTKESSEDDTNASHKGATTAKTQTDNQTKDDAQNQGKNLQIDLSNIKDKPVMWFRTTDEDFFDKLRSSADTPCSVLYFYQMPSQPVLEKDKQTTIFPNGTAVIETTETIWKHKDDPSPKIIKTTKIVQLEDDQT